MNLETKIIIYKFTPQVFTLTQERYSNGVNPVRFLNEEKKCSVDL